jgi:hypothetical protein
LSATSPGIPDLPRSRRSARLAITVVPEITPAPEKHGKPHKNPSFFGQRPTPTAAGLPLRARPCAPCSTPRPAPHRCPPRCPCVDGEIPST